MAAIALGVIVTRQAAPVAPPAAVTQPVEAPLVAVLTGKQGVVTVSFDRASARLTVAPSAIEIGDHSAELWVIPSDGKPRSLGVIATAAPGWRPAPTQAARAVAPGVTLAISIEPIGGSRTGQPTGPVILTGKVAPA
jgi:anti-sigma-K factor RskA